MSKNDWEQAQFLKLENQKLANKILLTLIHDLKKLRKRFVRWIWLEVNKARVDSDVENDGRNEFVRLADDQDKCELSV